MKRNKSFDEKDMVQKVGKTKVGTSNPNLALTPCRTTREKKRIEEQKRYGKQLKSFYCYKFAQNLEVYISMPTSLKKRK